MAQQNDQKGGTYDQTGGRKVDTETERLKKTGIKTPVGERSGNSDTENDTGLTTGGDMGTADDLGGSVS